MANRKFSLNEKITLFISLCLTKLFWRNARLIRYPHRIRNRNSMKYDKGFTLGYSCRIELNAGESDKVKLNIGRDFICGDYCHIVANSNVKIGDNVLLASRVFISDTSHGSYDLSISSDPTVAPNDRKLFFNSVTVGSNVWIGENVSVLPGSTIGKGSIIGANSVVSGDIPENCIAVGAPAKVIKTFNSDTMKWERIS